MSEWAREEAIRVAEEYLAGGRGVVETCRALVLLLPHDDPRLSGSEEVETIRSVESDADAFPLGPQRALWESTALMEMDQKLSGFEQRARKDVDEACRGLIEQLRSSAE